jgi:hypothetical protein
LQATEIALDREGCAIRRFRNHGDAQNRDIISETGRP